METQMIVAFVFGVVFIVTMLVLAVFFPKPEPFQYTVFRVTLSLAAGGVAAMIPGFINLSINPSAALAIRAGGALAVFLIVYFRSPAALVTERRQSEIVSACQEALDSLRNLDNAIRQTVGPITRFDLTWSKETRDDAIKELGKLADTEKILPRVRQSNSMLRRVRDSSKISQKEKELADIILACGDQVLQALGESTVTPWNGPQELARIVDLVRFADTASSATEVKQQAETVNGLVNRELMAKADHALGTLSHL
jgi:hypothetical protein